MLIKIYQIFKPTLFVVLFCFLGSCAQISSDDNQSLIKTSVCEITENSSKFLGRHIKITGFIKPSYNSIYDQKCRGKYLPTAQIPADQFGRLDLARHLELIGSPDALLYSPNAAVVADFIGNILSPYENNLSSTSIRLQVYRIENIRIEEIPEAALLKYRPDYTIHQYDSGTL